MGPSRAAARRLLLPALLAAFAACGRDAVEGPPPAPADPALGQLLCAAPAHDFGAVWEGERVEHRFELAVGPGAPLELVQLKPGCGCSSARLWVVGPDGDESAAPLGTPLAPGTRLALDVVYDTHGRAGAGPLVVAFFGNVEGGRTTVRLDGEVRSYLSFEPREVDLDVVLRAEGASGSAVVASADGEPFEARLDADALAPGVAAELTPLDAVADGRAARWRVDVTVGPAAERGPHRYAVPVRSGRTVDTATGPVALAGVGVVRAIVVDPLEAQPVLFDLGLMRAGASATASVDLLPFGPGPDGEPAVAEVAVSVGGTDVSDAFRARIEPSEPTGWGLVLETDGLAEGLRGPLEGRVVVRVGRPTQPALEVPLRGAALGY